MNTVIILSDSHGLTNELIAIKERHKDEADLMVHCGDSELPFSSKEMKGFTKVRGNCDYDHDYNELERFSVGELHFLVTHGHLYHVKTTLKPLSYKAEEASAEVALFGHSHIAGAEKIKGCLFINPGSIRLPRGRKEKTYVRLTWDQTKQFKVEFLDVKTGTTINNMTYVDTFEER